jgi:hypothetical protein
MFTMPANPRFITDTVPLSDGYQADLLINQTLKASFAEVFNQLVSQIPV